MEAPGVEPRTPVKHVTSIAFDFLHICMWIHYCTVASVDSTMSAACQGFGAQRDAASCRKRESRGKAKQDIFRSVRGAAPILLSALGGKRARGSGLSLLLSPLLCPDSALLCSALLCSPWDMCSLQVLLFLPTVTLTQTAVQVTLYGRSFWETPVPPQCLFLDQWPFSVCEVSFNVRRRIINRNLLIRTVTLTVTWIHVYTFYEIVIRA